MLAKIPMTTEIAAASDAGDVENLQDNWFDEAIKAIEAIPSKEK